MGIVPFETNVQNTCQGCQTYLQPTKGGSIDGFINNLQSTLGNGTDTQGVLDYARAPPWPPTCRPSPRTSSRAAGTSWCSSPTELYPRCTATETLTGALPNSDYANYDPFNAPWLTWMDDPQPPTAYCLSQPSGMIDNGMLMNGNPPGVSGYTFGSDRNQNYQIFDTVNQMMSLKAEYNVAAVNLDTVLILNPRGAAVRPDLPGSLRHLSGPERPRSFRRPPSRWRAGCSPTWPGLATGSSRRSPTVRSRTSAWPAWTTLPSPRPT